MKTRIIIVACMLGGFIGALSQAEYDDVYFSKKDRTQIVASAAPMHKTNKALEETTSVYQAMAPINLPSGYTGRTINPDYQPGGVSVVKSSYFTPNYQPVGVNGQLNQNNYAANNNYYNNYNSPYGYYGNNYGYNGGYYSPYSSGWGYSPYGYGGGYYSPYNSFGYSPYGYGGFGSGFGCYSCYSGMGFGMGMGLGMSYGFGGGYYGSYYGGYYPNTVVIVNHADTHINNVYGKRQSRSADYYDNNMARTQMSRGSVISTTDQSQANRSGRVAASSNAYYQRGWRQDPAMNPTSTDSGSRVSGFSGSSGNRSAWGGFGTDSNSNGTSRGSSAWDNSGFGSGSRSGSMSSGGGFSGGGSRSFGGSSGGSSGGGHSSGGTRGRN